MAIGSGMSFTSDLAEAGVLLAEGKLRRCTPATLHFFGTCAWVWWEVRPAAKSWNACLRPQEGHL